MPVNCLGLICNCHLSALRSAPCVMSGPSIQVTEETRTKTRPITRASSRGEGLIFSESQSRGLGINGAWFVPGLVNRCNDCEVNRCNDCEETMDIMHKLTQGCGLTSLFTRPGPGPVLPLTHNTCWHSSMVLIVCNLPKSIIICYCKTNLRCDLEMIGWIQKW